MVVKQGKFGKFLACSGYPECSHTRSLNANGPGEPIGMTCPEAGCGGEILEKRSKRGKIFYGCSRYPDCKFATWDKPVATPCPHCGASYLVEKTTKKSGTLRVCLSPGCGYKAPLE
jgi:DNA topoisomerase-1